MGRPARRPAIGADVVGVRRLEVMPVCAAVHVRRALVPARGRIHALIAAWSRMRFATRMFCRVWHRSLRRTAMLVLTLLAERQGAVDHKQCANQGGASLDCHKGLLVLRLIGHNPTLSSQPVKASFARAANVGPRRCVSLRSCSTLTPAVAPISQACPTSHGSMSCGRTSGWH